MGQSCIKEVATKELRMKGKDRAQKRGFKGSMQRKNSNQQEAQQIKQEEVGEGVGGEGVRGCSVPSDCAAAGLRAPTATA